jgi:mersacidin/lichenicidin family type 2 lantibiotic
MSSKNIIRAWKDPVYRNSLSAAERAALPANPAGSIELSDADLGQVAGGYLTIICTKICSRNSCDCSTAWPNGRPC